MKIGIIGLGLMGGSFALDIKSVYPKSRIFGSDISKINEERAIELGLIDKVIDLIEFNQMDLILVSIPVDKSIYVIPKILDIINKRTLVFDVGSTKDAICKSIKNHPRRGNFLASHPMAGTEFSGPDAAERGLYFNKTNIICEVDKTNLEIRDKALEIFRSLNMKVIYMDAKPHDIHVAYVSHLSHISSFMLGKTVIEKEKNEKNIFDLAGSGFESTVRLAKSSPQTWTPIFLQNKKNIVLAIEEYVLNLKSLKKIIEENDEANLSNVLNNTNRIKEILEKYNT
tara:strand:- start:14 stop:865 length:852 start_codon:yes stop_codon:yes gene_type:complete